MITPKYIKEQSNIIINSPSNGIAKKEKMKQLDRAISYLKIRYNVLEDDNVRKSVNGASADVKSRANELNEIINNNEIEAVISVTGGDYLYEIMPYVNFDNLIGNPKWFQGQSDTTILLFIITTLCDIKTIYSFNATAFGNNYNLPMENNIDILEGNLVKQYDYKCPGWITSTPINTTGRIIGGCLECIIDIIGTKYDIVNNFIEKYKKDKIIWYFDIDYMNNEQLLRNLLHLDNLGWFKYTDLIILGRYDGDTYTNINLDDVIKRSISKDIDYIYNFDLGHTDPRITIINGSIAKIIFNNQEHSIEFMED